VKDKTPYPYPSSCLAVTAFQILIRQKTNER
jgi:hypothetical protein